MGARFGYFWRADLTERDPGPLCPEKPERIEVLKPESILQEAMAAAACRFESRPAHILGLAHEPRYIGRVERAHADGLRALDSGDTRVTANTFDQALLSVSAGCRALDRIFAGSIDRAFCAVRPPGHHANAGRALGFCVFNNIAIAARYAQQTHGARRVLIIDWDVHPGNGTQEIFWRDPSVFTFSIHQADHMEQSGLARLVGDGPGSGFNLNVPLAPGTNAAAYHASFNGALENVLSRFTPDLVLISAGFDAHRNDPASALGLHDEDFARLTRTIRRMTESSAGGRLLSILEGGYNLGSLAAGVRAHCRAMAE